jgi:hypothetical protein
MDTDRMQIITHTVGGIRTGEEILTVVAGIPTAVIEAPEIATPEVITAIATDLPTLQHQPHQHHLAQPDRRPITPLNTPNTMPTSLVETPMQHTEAMRTMLPTTNTMRNSRLSSQGQTRLHHLLQGEMQLRRLHLGLP